MSWWMVKNSRGKKDALLTFSAWAVLVVLLKLLVNGASAVVFDHPITFGVIDATLIGAALTPTIGAYTWKRLKGGKNDEEPKAP